MSVLQFTTLKSNLLIQKGRGKLLKNMNEIFANCLMEDALPDTTCAQTGNLSTAKLQLLTAELL